MANNDSDDFGDSEDFGLGGGIENYPAPGSLQAYEAVDLYKDVLAGVPGNADKPDSSKSAAGGAPAADAAARAKPAPAGGGGGTTAVYVGGLHWWTTDAELEALCREYGELAALRFFEDKSNGKSKGYALVEFTAADSAPRCKEGLNGQPINGKKCVVTYAASATGAARLGSVAGHGTSILGQGRGALHGGQGLPPGMPPGVPGGMPMPPGGMPMPPGMMPIMPGMGIPGLAMPGMMMPGMGSMPMHMPGMPQWGGPGRGAWRGNDAGGNFKRQRS
ncbi:hypothetical protein WJX81_002599 [Elliptochloris bilobata]|uniref:RRM domain-containing protein n=1 Tax=Elliptochloris bilobata TaxID=381761 RepID=A0AAW1RDZ9_9CHLO